MIVFKYLDGSEEAKSQTSLFYYMNGYPYYFHRFSEPKREQATNKQSEVQQKKKERRKVV